MRVRRILKYLENGMKQEMKDKCIYRRGDNDYGKRISRDNR